MSSSLKKTAIASALAVVASASIPAVYGQAMLEEVIVTAQKRAESMQDVPIAVTAVTGAQIENAGIQGLEDLSAYVPNMSINTQAGGSPGNIVIRGVGSGNNAAFEQSVGMFIDGVYAGRARQFLVPFLDLASVEVLKGPQGTLFGKNTVAGAISLSSARPSEEFEASIRAHYEPEYGTEELTGVVSGPLTDNLSGRIAGRYRDQGEYVDNLVRNKDEPEVEQQALRGSLLYSPTDTVEIFTKLEYTSQEATGSSFQMDILDGVFRGSELVDLISPLEDGKLDDKTTFDSFNEESNDTDSLNGVVRVDWDLAPFTLTSITGYSDYDVEYRTDVDFSSLHFLESVAEEDFDQLSQEFRIVSPGGETLDYIAGIYMETQSLANSTRNDLDASAAGLALPAVGGVANFDQDADTVAVFAQATWQMADNWSLTGGLRWAREEKEATLDRYSADFGTNDPNPSLDPITKIVNGGDTFTIDDERSSSNWSPTANLQWDYSDAGMAYLRASRGYKSGGFNAAMVAETPEEFEFDDEVVDGIELGSKTTLLDGAATLNLALFYNKFSDRQVSAFTETGFVVGNAAESTSQGIEAEGRWKATENLTLSLSMAYLQSEYDEFEDAGCSNEQKRVDNPAPGCDPVTESQDLTGQTTAHAPEWAGTFIADYYLPVGNSMEFRANLDVIYSDAFNLEQALDSNLVQDSYTLVNGRVGLASADDVWELALVGKNLTDKVKSDYGAGIPLFTGAYFRSVNAPRTIAIEAVYRFF
ncbi:MAG: TonB-dependent receptor [Halioglobus sp.]